MLRGDSLSMGLSEGPTAALVEHGANMMMIEQGAQQPETWAQDIPVAMRTPSLEARQVGQPRVTYSFITAGHSSTSGSRCTHCARANVDWTCMRSWQGQSFQQAAAGIIGALLMSKLTFRINMPASFAVH